MNENQSSSYSPKSKENNSEDQYNPPSFFARSYSGPPGAVGLVNIGCSCYLNGVLQSLAVVDPLTKFLASEEFLNKQTSDLPVSQALGKIFQSIWSGSSHDYSKHLNEFHKRFAEFHREYQLMQAKDALEFLANLLNIINDELTSTNLQPPIFHSLNVNIPKNSLYNPHSFIHSLFGCIQTSQLLCENKYCDRYENIKEMKNGAHELIFWIDVPFENPSSTQELYTTHNITVNVKLATMKGKQIKPDKFFGSFSMEITKNIDFGKLVDEILVKIIENFREDYLKYQNYYYFQLNAAQQKNPDTLYIFSNPNIKSNWNSEDILLKNFKGSVLNVVVLWPTKPNYAETQNSIPKRTVKLEQCIQTIMHDTNVMCSDKIECLSCGTLLGSLKMRARITHLSDYLLINMKNSFEINQNIHHGGLTIEFPTQGLDLGFLIDDFKNPKHYIYDAIAICYHVGSCRFGHCKAKCYNPRDGKWREFDDMNVYEIDTPRYVKSPSVFIIYKRRTSPEKPITPSGNGHWSSNQRKNNVNCDSCQLHDSNPTNLAYRR